VRRFLSAVILFLVFLPAGIVQAQTCPPPVIVLVGGSNPACAGQPVTLDAGAGWATYQWSPGGATTEMISDSPSATMSYTVTTTDASGCSVTSQPLTVVVNAAPATPSIHLLDTAICAAGASSAYVDGPPGGGSWSSIQWTLGNATSSDLTGNHVSFVADGSGQPVSLQVTVRDASSCSVDASANVSIRTITPPTVNLVDTAVCANGSTYAYIDGPSGQNNNWQQVIWSIEHGTINWGQGNTNIGLTADGSGQPVVIHVHVKDNYACEADASGTVAIRTIAPPTLHLVDTAICSSGTPTYAYIEGPSGQYNSWQQITWSFEHGTIAWGQGNTNVGFTADGSGQPVVIHVHVKDNYACEADATATLPIHTVPAVSITLDQSTVCTSGYGAGTIDAGVPENPWTSITWTVENGTVVYGQGTTRVNFQADGSGNAVVLHVSAQDSSYCPAQSSVTIPTRTVTPPVIALGTGSCPTTASVTNASDYVLFQWSADNAQISSSLYDSSITFHPSLNGHVTLTVLARDASGCDTTASIGYDATGLPDVSVTLSSVPFCYGSPASASIPDGGPGVTYQWSMNSGQFLSSPTAASVTFIPQADTLALTVTATNADGCSASGGAYVWVVRPPVGDFNSVPAAICANGTATISTYANGVSYDWQVIDGDIVSGAGTSAITFRAHTAATVTIRLTKTGQYGCGATYERVIPVTAVDATVTASGPTTFCAGGSVTLTAPSGLSYLWSTGATTQSLGVYASGSYSVTVTGAGACSVTSTPTVVTVNALPSASITAGGPTTFCAGGSVTLTASTGASYLWSNGATTQSIAPGTSGSYSVSVTDANGCRATSAPTVVTANAAPTVTITAGGPTTFCAGGSVTLTASTGASYLWSNGATTQAISASASGNYSVTVTNANGCSATSAPTAVTVSAPTAAITAGGPTTFCAGGSVTLTANSGASYLWSNGATTQAIAVSTAGNYSVTVTNANGCSATSTPASVTVNASLYAYILNAPPGRIGFGNGSDRWCEGTVVTLTAKPDGMTYLWSTGQTTQAITVNSQATYSVTVTNANGCSAVNSANVWYDPAPKPVINPPASTSFCGIIQLTTNAVAGAQYSWVRQGAGTIGSGPSITVQDSGTYYVLAQYNDSCSSQSDPITLTRLPDPQGSITASSPKLCPGGSVALTASVNDPSATFLWATGETTSTLTVSTIGYYIVHVTEASGCAFDLAYNLTADTTPQPSIAVFPSNATVCDGGSVNLFAGSEPVLWSNGVTATQIDVTTEGDYFFTRTDTFGCTMSSNTVHVTIKPLPAKPTITAGGPTTFCLAVGSVTLTSSPGTAYHWSYGATTQSINAMYTGDYTVQVLGANGCWSPPSDPIHVTANMPPLATITASGPTTFCGGQSVTLTANGGTTVRWITGETTRSITVTATGNYSVTTTDDNGCSSTSATASVTVNPSPSAAITLSGPTTFCDGGSVTLTAAAAASYSWSNGATTRAITVSSSGTYSVVVTAANGCSVTSAPTVVTVNPMPVATITASGPTTFCAGGSVSLTASAGGGYLWSTGATTQTIAVTATGDYTVTVADPAGCTKTSPAVHVTANALPITTINTSASICSSTSGENAQVPNLSGATYNWTITNGRITDPTLYEIVYWPTAAGPLTLNVTVTDANGCVSSGSRTISVTEPPTPSINVSGATTFCAGGSVTLTGPAGYQQYIWNTAGGYLSNYGQQIVVNSSSWYELQVRDASGCLSPRSARVTVTANALPASPVITASGPTQFCAGGSVTLTSPAAASYLWSNGATTQSIVVTASGNYGVTVTDANGCSATSMSATTVQVLALPPIPTVTGATTFCQGGSTTLTSSYSPYGYHWSNGATTQSISVTAAGSYSVTTTDYSGCSATSAATVVTTNALPTAAITAGGPTAFCPGGSVTLTASAGSGYSWSNGATTQSIAVTTGGNYSVTVTGANGCSATSAPTVVTINALPAATITAGGPTTFCTGGNVTLTASSGASYLWSTGATTQAITASASGNYSVTVTGANGCSATSAPTSVTSDAPQPATVTPAGSTTFCAGSFAHLTASSGASYLWSTGSTSQSIDVSATGSYSVTVTDANGCSTTSAPTTATMNPYVNAAITPSGPNTFCAGGSVTLTASGGVSYHWSTGATTAAIVVTTAGNNFVTVTDANGCSASTSWMVYVNPNPQPVVTAGGPTTFCAGGSVTLTSSSASSYLWSNGATTQSIAASTSGSYSVTVTDANGCHGTSAATVVTVNPAPATITAGGPTTFCTGGSVTLTASSGASYLWSTGATTQSIAVSTSGNYTVNVTNANGCSATSSPTAVTVNALPTATVTAGGPTTFCAGGSVTLTASAGATYLWSTGATTQAISATAAGSYSVTVTNASGCSATSAPAVVTVNANPTAAITAGGPTTFCASGSVTLTASSGTSYLWSTGATTQAIAANTTGNYSVTVTNANGCSATSSPTTVTVNANPTATITAGGPTTFCTGGNVTLTASSGSSYLWSTGATTSSITVSAGGNYSVTVTNANGCSATSSPTMVTVNANPTATITAGGPTTFCAGGNVTLTASSGASYLWSTGATTQSIAVSASGNYTVNVTNANGCSATSSPTTVTVNANPTATITAGGPTTFCTGGSVTLTASSGASYLWSTGATTQAITASSSGSYSVTVTGANGCSATSSPTAVTVNAKPTATITPGGPTTFCTGGSVTLTSSAGTSYLWSTDATTQAISATSAGSYTVTVTNASGCSATSAATVVTVNTNPSATITAGGPTTFCPGGSVTLTASSGSSYLWSTGATTQAINATTSGNYTVTVTNASGCQGTSAATVVTVNAAASITTQPVNKTTTRNTNVTLTVVAAGTSPISYQWFKGSGTSISGATSSSYTTSFPNKGTNTFYVEVWNACNATHVKSTTVTVTVN